jgi:hypothetical protein
MSIIEKAAGKLGAEYQTPPARPAPAGGDAQRERALIEESIERPRPPSGNRPPSPPERRRLQRTTVRSRSGAGPRVRPPST